MNQRRYLCLLIIAPLLCFLAVQRGTPAPGAELGPPPGLSSSNLYEFRQQHDPEGIGKFYMGREIAKVMGHEGADWLERPERDSEEDPRRLVKELRIEPTDAVADIGAGTGYLTRRLAREAGRVFAVDIQPEMLNRLSNSLAQAGIANVTPVLGSVTNPALPPSSVDLVVMVDVYHEFDFPFEMVESISRALKPQGRIALVEYRAEDAGVPIKALHKMTEAQVKREMASHPLRWTQTISVLPWQHIVLFTKASTSSPLEYPAQLRTITDSAP